MAVSIIGYSAWPYVFFYRPSVIIQDGRDSKESEYGFKKVKFDDIGLDCNLSDTNENMYMIPTKIKKIPFGDIYE